MPQAFRELRSDRSKSSDRSPPTHPTLMALPKSHSLQEAFLEFPTQGHLAASSETPRTAGSVPSPWLPSQPQGDVSIGDDKFLYLHCDGNYMTVHLLKLIKQFKGVSYTVCK